MSEPAGPPSGMASRKIFELLGNSVAKGCTARLGRLSVPGRRTVETPNYTAVTSRGAVPHLTPDNVKNHTSVESVYMALEDFVERKEPPIYKTPDHAERRRLHNFTGLASDRITVLGARRCPPVLTPMGNGAKTVTLFTSTGFANISVPQYVAAVKTLQPDIVIPLSDTLHTSTTPAAKKLVRMVERTEEWVDDFLRLLESRENMDQLGLAVFAPVLPVELPMQWAYLQHLSEDAVDSLTGLAIYDVNLLPELEMYKALSALPKLSVNPPKSPHDVLRQISLGVDLVALPFVNSVSDSGVALTFKFPPPDTDTPQELGINMWSPEHNVSLTPLQEGCSCYACSTHHRAYLQHLLNAKEMLGWNLLQIHNHRVMDDFFQGIRKELKKGVEHFEESRQRFLAAYESEIPLGTGDRPRARGYHFKSEAGQEKIRNSGWVADLNGKAASGAEDMPGVAST